MRSLSSSVSNLRGRAGYYFGHTAIRSISTKAPRAPAGRTTCTVVDAGLLGWSLAPKNWLYLAIIPAKSISRPWRDRPQGTLITTSVSVSFCDLKSFGCP